MRGKNTTIAILQQYLLRYLLNGSIRVNWIPNSLNFNSLNPKQTAFMKNWGHLLKMVTQKQITLWDISTQVLSENVLIQLKPDLNKFQGQPWEDNEIKFWKCKL